MKVHLEAMRKIDPNYMRGNSHSEPEPQKQKLDKGNDFRCSSRASVYSD